MAPRSQKSPKAEKRRGVYWVVSTHWDREWYEPFQGFRYRLVGLLDEVLETMERDPRFSHFQLDGQSSPIEDYLEVRPENEGRVRQLAQAGRLGLGPWYTMPDELILSGEALVRNLQEGLRVARRFGPPSRAGFICDIFGHNSQLPQILRGFGIDNAFLWRGADEERQGPCFRWRGADGSEVLAVRFGPKNGYCDYAFAVRAADDHTAEFDVKAALPKARRFVKMQAERFGALPVLVFDGGDHLEIEPQTGELLERLRAGALGRDFELKMGLLDDFAAELRKHKRAIRRVTEGELRQCRRTSRDQDWLIPGVAASRIPLKQANARCESLLTQWAEPFSLFAGRAGLEYPHGFLRVAWRNVILNHAHDSICGCSIDQVHRDMTHRYEQAELVGERLRRAALERVGEAVARGVKRELKSKPLPRLLVLFNPTPRTLDEPLDFTVRLPQDTPVFHEFFGYEPLPGFWLTDASGARVPYQRIAQSANHPEMIVERRKFPKAPPHWRIDVSARVRVPAYGYTTLAVETTGEPTRRGGQGLATGPASAENEFLALEIGAGGMLSLTDKRNGQRYEKLLQLEDRADIGDGWFHAAPASDEVHFSGAATASVARLTDGPERATFRVELRWPLPAHFEFENMVRSAERRELRVEHEVTLRSGVDRVEVRTTVHNELRDHRLRVLFPSGAEGGEYWADSAYDTVRRPIALDPASHRWAELEVETKPQQSWTAVVGLGSQAAGLRGLAVISRGLPESSVCDWPERPIALTLFRGFRRTVMTKGEPESQLRKTLRFDYWIKPLTDLPDAAALCRDGQQLAAGVAAHQPRPVNLTNDPKQPTKPAKFGRGPVLPRTFGFLEVEGPVVVTAVRATPDAAPDAAPDCSQPADAEPDRLSAASGATVVRLFNPADDDAACTLSLPGGIGEAWSCDLEEAPLEPLPVEDGKVALSVPPRRILTLLLKPSGEI